MNGKDYLRTPAPQGPDFVGVGMQKCGTSWLAEMLAQHPDVLVRKKEINFFVRFYRKGYGWYDHWFRDKDGKLAGEFTQSYMISPRPDPSRKEWYPRWNPRRTLMFWQEQPSARDELRRHYPDVRVFCMLRDPADRAWSAYWYWRRRRERLDKRIIPFERMWEDDGRWLQTRGMYAHYLSHWREVFPDLGVFFYDDIAADPEGLCRSAYRFIGVDDTFVPRISEWVNKGRYDQMPEETRRMLIDFYRDEIGRLEEMTERDLSAWLKV